MLWACLDRGAISELDLCRTHFLWQVAAWVMNGLLLSRLIHVFSWVHSHHQPLSRRGCCKVKSVRDFGDIMDEWSQVEWSCCQKETPFILNRNLKRSHDQQILDQFQVIYEDVVKATFLESWTVSSIKVSHHQLITTLLNLIIRAKPMTLTFLSQAAATDPWPPLPEPRLDSQVNKNNGMYFLPYS